MSTKTIHTLAYRLLVDSSEFRKGTTLSRGEVSQLKREMRSTQTPMERMETDLMKLGQLAKKDAIAQEVYNRKLRQYRQELVRVNKQNSFFQKHLGGIAGKLGISGKAGAIGAAVGATTLAVRRGWQEFEKYRKEIDTIAKNSKKLGVTTEFLTSMQFAGGQMAGLSDEQTAKGLEKFTRRVSEAAVGLGEARGVLEELKLDARELAMMGPEKAILKVADAMGSVTAEHDRLRIATKLFDDEQAAMHLALNDNLRGNLDLAKDLGIALDSFDAREIESVTDAMDKFDKAYAAFGREFSAELAPAIKEVADLLTDTMKAWRQFRGANKGMFGTGLQAFLRTERKSSLFNQPQNINPIAKMINKAANFAESKFEVDNEKANRKQQMLFEKEMAERKRLEEHQAKLALPMKQAESLGKAGKLFADEFMLRLKNQFPNDDPFGLQQQQADWKGMWDSTVSKFWEELPKHRPEPDDPFGLGKQDQFTVGTAGPSEAIWANTSEAFAIQNRMAFVDTLKDPTKQTANNTSRMVFLLEQMQNKSEPVDGGGSLDG